MKNFVIIGAAGYIAPRHMRAIRDTGNNLIAALDPSDSVGIIDSFFPKASFFTEFERFDRHIEKIKRKGVKIDYVVVCSPNYLHDAHCRFGLRHGADVICEKPVVLNPWNLEALLQMEEESNRRIFCILQLRHHPNIIELRKNILNASKDKIYDVDLTYLTSRGNWYYSSWKGDESKSGGVATNIGLHLFDMLIWIFGAVKENVVHVRTHDTASGYLVLERAKVKWFLSISDNNIPQELKEKHVRTYRALKIEEREFDFSTGFENLHQLSYDNIMKGKGFNLKDSQKAIELVHDIRNLPPKGLVGEYHKMANNNLSSHPFQRKK